MTLMMPTTQAGYQWRQSGWFVDNVGADVGGEPLRVGTSALLRVRSSPRVEKVDAERDLGCGEQG